MSTTVNNNNSNTNTLQAKLGEDVSNNVEMKYRKSSSRGFADHDWLYTYHTFSFASYYNPQLEGFGPLRVINEDRVTASNGFPRHPHNNFEIYSYIVNGAILHEDSMGNKEILKRGDVQFTSAGTGLSHSEYNASDKDLLHFLQIWVVPDKRNLKPGYQTQNFPDAEKEGKLRLIISPDGKDKSIKIHNDVYQYASLIKNGEEIQHSISPNRLTYIQVVMDVTDRDKEANETGIVVNGQALKGGDGLFITLKDNTLGAQLVIKGNHKSNDKRAEFLLFDLPKQ